MKNILGKNFYEMKKFPYPISFENCFDTENNLDKQKLTKILNELEKSTFVHIGMGAEFSFKIARF